MPHQRSIFLLALMVAGGMLTAAGADEPLELVAPQLPEIQLPEIQLPEIQLPEAQPLEAQPLATFPPIARLSASSLPTIPSPTPQLLSISGAQAKDSIQWLATTAIEKMPPVLDGDKGWGDTKRVWSGVKIRRDGFKLKTRRRFREVDHGRWVKYEVELPRNAPTVTIQQVVSKTDPDTGDQRWWIESSVVAPMKFTARVQRWNLGVKLFSVTVSGEMRVRLVSSATVGFYADYAEIPPALVVDPRIETAQLSLERFEVDRVSHIGGDVAEQWGEMVEDILVDRLIKQQNKRIVAKLNKSIEKERDDLRISLTQWLGAWSTSSESDSESVPDQSSAN